jgi:hypothetical protein
MLFMGNQWELNPHVSDSKINKKIKLSIYFLSLVFYLIRKVNMRNVRY